MILGLMTAAQHRAAMEEALRSHEQNRRVTEGVLNARIKNLRAQLAKTYVRNGKGQIVRHPSHQDVPVFGVSTTSAGETADV